MPSVAAGIFPSSASEMDALLGFEGTRKPDNVIVPTPGRNKVEWKPTANVTIVYEEHPYDVGAPISHTGPHWHLTTPVEDHTRYLPGDPFPNR